MFQINKDFYNAIEGSADYALHGRFTGTTLGGCNVEGSCFRTEYEYVRCYRPDDICEICGPMLLTVSEHVLIKTHEGWVEIVPDSLVYMEENE